MKKLVVAVAAFAIAYLLYGSFSRSDHSVIERLLADVSAEASFEQSDVKSIEHMMWAGSLADRCAVPCRITVRVQGQEPKLRAVTKQEIIQYLTAARKELSKLEIRFTHPVIQVDGNDAMVEGMARALGRSMGREDFFEEVHPVRVHLKKDGGWKITAMENLDALTAE